MYFKEDLVRNNKHTRFFEISEPENNIIVLGRSRSIEGDVHEDECRKDNIEIIKRISGGGTVLLAPGMLVWNLLFPTQNFCLNQTKWFKILSGWVLNCLSELGIKEGVIEGVSDITIKNKKICGTALYIGANRILYHGTLLIDINPAVFDKYLKIPDRMPEYRQNRNHSEFVTTLKIEGYNLNNDEIIEVFNESMKPEEINYLKI